MVHCRHSVLTFGFVMATACAQVPDLAASVEQLADAAQRDAARARLLAAGAAAAEPLAARLATAKEEHVRICLGVLEELGPDARAAIPRLVALLVQDERGQKTPCSVAALATLAELIPYRDEDLAARDRSRVLTSDWVIYEEPAACFAWCVAVRRFHEREKLPLRPRLAALLELVQDHHPWVAEAAIQQLGARGPSAAKAVPLLRAVLQRPEPRILPGQERVPLHRRAARALLAMAPDGPDAATARAVLANAWTPPAARSAPERARERITQLLAELGDIDAGVRAAAADNLVALGAVAAEPLSALLTATTADAKVADALEVLRRLGKDGATAVPALAEALLELSTTHTVAVLRALAATVPWCDHVYVLPFGNRNLGDLTFHGHRIRGTVDLQLLNAVGVAERALHIVLSVPVQGSPERLRPLLDDPWVALRRRALEVIVMRGSVCAGLLDELGPMLIGVHPVEWVTERTGANGVNTRKVDRTDEIQRLAATAILAIAPSDHPLVERARQRLAQPVAK